MTNSAVHHGTLKLLPAYTGCTSLDEAKDTLRVSLLDPVDFVISKLRRGTEQDLADAEFVARRHAVSVTAIRVAADAAIAASPKDTALFVFRKIVELFLQRLESV